MKPVFQWVYASPARAEPSPAAPARAGSGSAGGAISDRIEQAFAAASSTTGTSFDYLVKTARRESAMNPAARAPTSSATGLFQFIESTWLETMKLSGPALGLGHHADRIVVGADGRYRVPDPEARREILDLRKDPDIASVMAGALTRRNAAYLADRLGRSPSEGELYIAHFLGAAGAASLIALAGATPAAAAADHFPRQAAANRSIFYEGGRPLSVAAVYADLVATHAGPAPGFAPPVTATAFAAIDPAPEALAPPMSSADAGARVAMGWQAVTPSDAFTGLFRTGGPASAGPAPARLQAFALAPALFDLAVEEDERERGRGGAPGAPTPREASLMARAGLGAGGGPLDLSSFLDTGEG